MTPILSMLTRHHLRTQFNRSADDAVSLALHHIIHRPNETTLPSVLFIDFNTANPGKDLTVTSATEHRLWMWVARAGTPQGCVISQLLFSRFTNWFSSHNVSVKFFKYADDTTIILDRSQRTTSRSSYHKEVARAVTWCESDDLIPTTFNTKQLIIDFGKSPNHNAPVRTGNQSITITDSCAHTSVAC